MDVYFQVNNIYARKRKKRQSMTRFVAPTKMFLNKDWDIQ